MVEPSRIKTLPLLVLLAMAQLATEVTRLVVAWTPAHISPRAPTGEQTSSSQRNGRGSEPEVRKDLETRKDLEAKPTMRPVPATPREPPPDARRYGPAPLRPDFSVSYRPWVRRPVWRCERRYDGWYCERYDGG
jgi:hypothetical protein